MRMTQGVRLGRLLGIEIVMDWSLLIIFLLVSLSLSAGVFPAWHPDWSAALCWATGLAAAVLFFVSVLLHELSHAVVGRANGIGFSRITLFVFGGMAHMEGEPPSWRAEFAMAIVGPLTSLALGFFFLFLAGAFFETGAIDPGDPAATLAAAGPVATLLLWLGPVNVLLGLFNLVPGFPLDGGRVLRAFAWGITGDMQKATRWASLGGQAFAWLLMATGLAMVLGLSVPPFGRGLVNGLWLTFIGWFLNTAAVASYRDMVLRRSLAGIPVRRLMQTKLVTVDPDLSIQRLVDEHMMASGQRAFPVTEDGRLEGLLSLGDLNRRERSRWPDSPVSAIMTPAAELVTVTPDQDAASAMEQLTRHEFDQLPVVRDGRLEGLLRRRDVLRWLSLHPEWSDENGRPRRME